MTEKLTIREKLGCRVLLLIAQLILREAPEQLRKEMQSIESKLSLYSE